MRHFKDPKFVPHYNNLPKKIQEIADKNFALLKENPRHSSLHFKRINQDLWSARVGLGYRALAVEAQDGFQWFWMARTQSMTSFSNSWPPLSLTVSAQPSAGARSSGASDTGRLKSC